MLLNKIELEEVFNLLKSAGYYFQPQSPNSILRMRKQPEIETELIKVFGLNRLDGLNRLELKKETKEKILNEPFSVTCGLSGEYFVHSHWPPQKENAQNYIHIGPETYFLANQIIDSTENFENVIDLGCSSGVLAFSISKKAKYIFGLDLSQNAIQTANLLKEIYNVNNVDFAQHKIEKNEVINPKYKGKFDLAVFNPPLAIPEEGNSFPHRDGGNLGIEMPLMFIDYAAQALKPNGQMWFLIANPIVGGKKQFDIELSKRNKLKVIESSVIEKHFNQAVFKAHKYESLGIERIELSIMKIKKV